MEENELNFFIKYGELGGEADVRDAYMKQKHRLIWERRHPDIMEARKQAYAEHKVLVSFALNSCTLSLVSCYSSVSDRIYCYTLS